MTRGEFDALCAARPGAVRSGPGELDSWKVGGKMFACIGAMDEGVAVKCADTDFAALLIEAGDARKAPYFHRSWVLIPWGADEGFMRDRIVISYDLIRSKLPKKVREGLAGRAG